MNRILSTFFAVVMSGMMILTIVGPAFGAAVIGDTAGIDSEAVETDRIEWGMDSAALDDGEVVVRFDPYDGETTAGSDGPADRNELIDRLEAHAETTQADLVEWAEATEGIEVTGQFWIVNAVVLSIEDDAPAAEIPTFSAVTGVHEPFEVTREAPTGGGATGDGATRHGATGDGSSSERMDDRADVTYGLDLIGAPEVWERFGTVGEGATVAVLDSGVEGNHPDIEVGTFQEFDERGEPVDSSPFDPSGQSHGTHVSGTIAGGDASGTAIGVAPGAELAVGAVLTNCGFGGCSGTFEQIIAGIEWAVADAEADVISMSLGFGGKSDRMVEPIRNARAAGTLVVASAGNSGHGSSGSPGNVYDSLSVGAVDEDRTVAKFSSGERVSKGDWNDPPDGWPDEYVVPTVTAPGVDVYSAQAPDGYGERSGTSMAAPHVAGVAALLVSAAPDADPTAIEHAIESTATKPDGKESSDRDIRYGSGVVDANAAVETLLRSADASPAVEEPRLSIADELGIGRRRFARFLDRSLTTGQ